MLAMVCPGQGAQVPGMLLGWVTLPGAAELLDRFSQAADLDLVRLGTMAEADEIAQTLNAQPLLVATELLSYRLATSRPSPAAAPEHRRCASKLSVVIAGHSVGMISAFAIAGAISDEAAVRLAAARGRVFSEVCTHDDAGMSALIGRGVREEFESGRWSQNLSVAVVNSPEQIVVAGASAELSELSQKVPRGIRVIPMAVTGAFHTEFIRPAQEKFANIVLQYEIRDPDKMVISDLTGQPFTGGKHGYGSATDIVQQLITQVTATVRWDLVTKQLANLASDGQLTEVFELAPSGTLSALLRRAKLGLPVQQVVPDLVVSPLEA